MSWHTPKAYRSTPPWLHPSLSLQLTRLQPGPVRLADMIARKQPVQMIAVDIDGTLLPSTGGRIGPRTIQALRSAEAAGLEIVIATGRRHAYAVPLIEPAELAAETVAISSNGAITRTFAGETTDSALLAPETARALCGLLRPYGDLVFTFDRKGPGELVIECVEQLHRRIAAWVDGNRESIQVVRPLELAFDHCGAPIQGMVCGALDAMREAQAALAASEHAGAIETHRTEYPTRELSILDVLPAGCSKGSALARLAAERGIDAARVMAIGDNFNDVEMLAWAGHAVVMANAAPGVLALAREHGWRITSSNDDDGAALAIESAIPAAAGVAANQLAGLRSLP